METINKVILKGGISGIRKMIIGENEVARFVLLTRHMVKSKGGLVRDETELHNIVAWKEDEMFDKLNDGKIVEVEGRLRYVKYLSAEGVEKVISEVIVNKLISVEDNG